ncbi:NAD(P)/FAD-dependent oxidoreductase [Kitasatospora sp. NPDC101183]|uniref:NAD(P)/FAD-dependent oxidoreductase n=1 Tax=Kitasatospora sp. NPDC101183 TaxID=3364100 RepID=UPI0038101188
MDEVDIAVVGGGIIGCLTARELLARRPERTVAVLDRDSVGSGASRRSAGLHFPRGATGRVRGMAAYSQQYYAELSSGRPELPIHQVGMDVVGAERAVLDSYLASARPTPATEGVWQVEGGQYADVAGLTGRIAGELRGGAVVHEGTGVTAIGLGPERITLALSSGGELTARQVVLAPGPWIAAPAWRELVAPLGVRVKKVVALHIDLVPAPTDRVVVFQEEDAFLLPLHDRGHWLFSYTCQEWGVDPDALGGEGLSDQDLGDALAVLRAVAPEYAAHCASGRVFCDAYSGTGEPVVRPLPADPRVVFAGAANGSGYRLAPAIAAQAADLIDIPFLTGSSRSHA